MRRRRNLRDHVAVGLSFACHRRWIKSAAPPCRTDSTWWRRLPSRATTTPSRKFRAPRRSIANHARSSSSATAAARSGSRSNRTRRTTPDGGVATIRSTTSLAKLSSATSPARIRASGARCTTVYPFMSNGPTLNFIELGKDRGNRRAEHPRRHGASFIWTLDRISRRAPARRRAGFTRRRARFRSVPAMHRAHVHPGLPGQRGKHRIRMGHPQMPHSSRRSRAGLCPAMPRARGMRTRPRTSLPGRRTGLPSDARAALDAPVLRSPFEARPLGFRAPCQTAYIPI